MNKELIANLKKSALKESQSGNVEKIREILKLITELTIFEVTVGAYKPTDSYNFIEDIAFALGFGSKRVQEFLDGTPISLTYEGMKVFISLAFKHTCDVVIKEKS